MSQQSNQSWALGVDLGGTKIAMAAVDGAGVATDYVKFPTPAGANPESVVSEIAKAIKQLTAKANSSPAGIGIGVAGQINPNNGDVIFGPNLRWKNVPFSAMLSQETGLPVTVLNDVRSAAWGEWLHGAGKGCDDIVCLFVGTGIGGGVVSGGRMLTGSANSACELGHITIDMYGPACTCGNVGCLEAHSSGWALAKITEEAIAADPKSGEAICKFNGGSAKGVMASTLIQAAHQGDPLAQIIIEEATLALVAGATSLVNAFNPRRMILGGGVVDAFPRLVERVHQGVKQRALSSATANFDVVRAHLGGQAGIIGAAAFALKQIQV